MATLALIVFQAYSQSHKTKSEQNSQNPSTPVSSTPQQQNNNPSLQPRPDEHIKADVWVIQSPPKDRYEKAAFWINAALAGIGVFGVCIAIWTVRTIKTQVNTFVSKERARITVDIKPIEPGSSEERNLRKLYDKTPMPPMGSNRTWYVDLLVANSGETNAFIGASLCKAFIKARGWNPQEEIFNSQIGLPKVMHPHVDAFEHRIRIETGQVLRPEVNEEIAQAIAHGSMGVYVIGHIEFGDVFGNRWTLKFCRRWGAWYFGGEWQGCNAWYDYPDDVLPEENRTNGEFRIKRPSLLRRIVRRMRKKEIGAPVIEIT